ncbi:MAG: alpha/beta fold hydrolase [Acidobacteriota bacterium]
MSKLYRSILCLATATVLSSCATIPSSEPALSPDHWAELAQQRLPMTEPCTRPGAKETLLCATLPVWEDREARSGRKIDLEMVIIPAATATPAPDPLFFLAGGPGAAASRMGLGMWQATPLRGRDIVLLDQRGTGASNPLDCDLGGAAGATPGKLEEMFPPDKVAACLEELSTRADVTLYTTPIAMDDLNEVRQWLGYDQINLRGGSYGSWAIQVYLQRHPETVRSALAIGMVSPERSNLAERGRLAQRTFERFAAACKGDTACGEAFPRMAAQLPRLLDRLESEPVTVTVPALDDPTTTRTLSLGRDYVAERIRLLVYYLFTARALPYAIDAADGGDWVPLARQLLFIERMFKSSLSYGMLLTVQCSEAMSIFDVDAALAADAESLFGNYRLAQQKQGCKAWPVADTPPLGFETLREVDVPVLFVSGRFDTVTAWEYGEEAIRWYPEGRHLIVEPAHHGVFDVDGAACLWGLMFDYFDQGGHETLDFTCVDEVGRPPWVLDSESFDTWWNEMTTWYL